MGRTSLLRLGGGAVGANYLRGLRVDEPFIRQTGIGNEQFHTDALGSTLALSNATGVIATSYSYEAFGKATITGVSSNPFQFAGRENDGAGVYFYRARYYSSRFHRFLSEDPILAPFVPLTAGGCLTTNNFVWLLPQNIKALASDLSQGLNAFAYVTNNPTRFLDPSGLDKCDLRKVGDDCRDAFQEMVNKQGGFGARDTQATCGAVAFSNLGFASGCGSDGGCLKNNIDSLYDKCKVLPGDQDSMNKLNSCRKDVKACIDKGGVGPRR